MTPVCLHFTPVWLNSPPDLFTFRQQVCWCWEWKSRLYVENENRGSVLLCFLGVAQLKIVYKKANQQAVFCLYKYDSQILILSTDTLLYKNRAIAGQRCLSLLYQQWHTRVLLCCWWNINFSIYFYEKMKCKK